MRPMSFTSSSFASRARAGVLPCVKLVVSQARLQVPTKKTRKRWSNKCSVGSARTLSNASPSVRSPSSCTQMLAPEWGRGSTACGLPTPALSTFLFFDRWRHLLGGAARRQRRLCSKRLDVILYRRQSSPSLGEIQFSAAWKHLLHTNNLIKRQPNSKKHSDPRPRGVQYWQAGHRDVSAWFGLHECPHHVAILLFVAFWRGRDEANAGWSKVRRFAHRDEAPSAVRYAAEFGAAFCADHFPARRRPRMCSN